MFGILELTGTLWQALVLQYIPCINPIPFMIWQLFELPPACIVNYTPPSI